MLVVGVQRFSHPARLSVARIGVIGDTMRVACGTRDAAEALRETMVAAGVHRGVS